MRQIVQARKESIREDTMYLKKDAKDLKIGDLVQVQPINGGPAVFTGTVNAVDLAKGFVWVRYTQDGIDLNREIPIVSYKFFRMSGPDTRPTMVSGGF